MLGLVIAGPRYEILEKNVTFYTNFILPPGTGLNDVKVDWYRNYIHLPQLPTEDQFSLTLWDVGYPAAGLIYAIMTVISTGETIKSNEIDFVVGKDPIPIVLDINSRKYIYANLGDTVALRPVCSITPPYADKVCRWYRFGVEISPDEDIDIVMDSPDKFGYYTLKTTGTCDGAFIPASEELVVEIIRQDSAPEPLVCPFIYTNDLNAYLPYGGGRNEAYMWIGWWVWDEIRNAVKNGINWTLDIPNSTYKYKCDLQKVAELLSKYPEVEIQESRNGYILSRKDLLP